MKLTGMLIGAREFDFTSDDGKRIVGAKLYVAQPSTSPGVTGSLTSEMPIHPDHVRDVIRSVAQLSLSEVEVSCEMQASGKNFRPVCVGVAAA